MNDNGGTAGVSVTTPASARREGHAVAGRHTSGVVLALAGHPEAADVDRLAVPTSTSSPPVAEIAGAKLTDEVRAQVEGRSLVPLLRDPKAEWPERILFTHVGRWPKGRSRRTTSTTIAGVAGPRWHLVCVSKDASKQLAALRREGRPRREEPTWPTSIPRW